MRSNLLIAEDDDLGCYLHDRPDLAEEETSDERLKSQSTAFIDDEQSFLFLRGTPVLPLMRVQRTQKPIPVPDDE
jgi:hypothetical protein